MSLKCSKYYKDQTSACSFGTNIQDEEYVMMDILQVFK